MSKKKESLARLNRALTKLANKTNIDEEVKESFLGENYEFRLGLIDLRREEATPETKEGADE